MHCLFCPEDIFLFHNNQAEDIFSFALCREHKDASTAEIISRANEIKSSWAQRDIIVYLAQIARQKYDEYRAGEEDLYPNEASSIMMQINAEVMAFLDLNALAGNLATMRDVLSHHKMYGRAYLYDQFLLIVDSWGREHLARKYCRSLKPTSSNAFQGEKRHLFLQ